MNDEIWKTKEGRLKVEDERWKKTENSKTQEIKSGRINRITSNSEKRNISVGRKESVRILLSSGSRNSSGCVFEKDSQAKDPDSRDRLCGY